jgi:hypothetical protein
MQGHGTHYSRKTFFQSSATQFAVYSTNMYVLTKPSQNLPIFEQMWAPEIMHAHIFRANLTEKRQLWKTRVIHRLTLIGHPSYGNQ